MLGAGVPLIDAVAYANRAAGIVVGKLGTATVDYDELFRHDRCVRERRSTHPTHDHHRHRRGRVYRQQSS